MALLLRLIRKYQHVLFFLFLELVAVLLHYSYDYKQKAKAGLAFRRVEASIEQYVAELATYWNLRVENRRLVNENISLRNQLANLQSKSLPDSNACEEFRGRRYTYLPATVVSNSITRAHNFFTLDRGWKDGVENQMGVLANGSVAGIVIASTKHYATAISLLNTDLKVSAKLKASGYTGTLSWDGDDYRIAKLTEIPHHVKIHSGDTVVTSGFSNIFPPDVMVGVVEEVQNRGGDFCTLDIRLFTDFKRLHHVSVVWDEDLPELDSLQVIQESYEE